MESIKFLNNNTNKNIKFQKYGEKNNSLISQKTQIDSTTIDDIKENQSIKNSLSQKSLYYLRLNDEKKITLKRKCSLKNIKSNYKLLIFLDNKTRNINSNIIKMQNNKINNNLLERPPKINI